MMTSGRALERIEQAMRTTPFCVCGEPNVPVSHGDDIWLECATRIEPKGILRRLISLDFAVGHTARVIVDGELAEAAA